MFARPIEIKCTVGPVNKVAINRHTGGGNRGCDEHRGDTAAVEVRAPDPVAVGPARRPVDVSTVDCQRFGKNA